MKEIWIVGEDAVSKEVLRRLIKEYAPFLLIKREEPVRGGQLKSMIKQFNRLSVFIPVILLGDLDAEYCAPLARIKLLDGAIQSDDFVINIAVDEAEAWLYADIDGFSAYLQVPKEALPQARLMMMNGPHARMEIDTGQKTSRHLTTVLIQQSRNSDLKKQIESSDGCCKGKEYNPAIIPFIRDIWNPEVARLSSYSLHTTIERIKRLNEKYRD